MTLTLQQKIKLMTARQLCERMEEIERYLYDITPKSSRYRPLHVELRMVRERWRQVTDPQLGL